MQISRRCFLLLSLVTGFGAMLPGMAKAQNNAFTKKKENALEAWNALSVEQKEKILKRWQMFRKLSASAKEKIRAAYRHFKSLPVEKQERIRLNLHRWQSLTDEERQKIQRQYQRWQKMSPEEQRHIRSRYRLWQENANARKMQNGAAADSLGHGKRPR